MHKQMVFWAWTTHNQHPITIITAHTQSNGMQTRSYTNTRHSGLPLWSWTMSVMITINHAPSSSLYAMVTCPIHGRVHHDRHGLNSTDHAKCVVACITWIQTTRPYASTPHARLQRNKPLTLMLNACYETSLGETNHQPVPHGPVNAQCNAQCNVTDHHPDRQGMPNTCIIRWPSRWRDVWCAHKTGFICCTHGSV
jgi:hypothetical protein